MSEIKFEIFQNPLELAKGFADEFRKICEEVIIVRSKINVALSGGSTPKMFFTILALEYKNKIEWSKIDFYWVDERCVKPDDEESNYGMTKKILLNNIEIPESNIQRMIGENDPEREAERYSEILKKNLPVKNNFPVFDLILLGVGEDGHTASIFPDQMDLLNGEKVCAVAIHPATLQKRITLTGNTINNAERIYFLVTGKGKENVVKDILEKRNDYLKYPAAHIKALDGIVKWWITF